MFNESSTFSRLERKSFLRFLLKKDSRSSQQARAVLKKNVQSQRLYISALILSVKYTLFLQSREGEGPQGSTGVHASANVCMQRSMFDIVRPWGSTPENCFLIFLKDRTFAERSHQEEKARKLFCHSWFWQSRKRFIVFCKCLRSQIRAWAPFSHKTHGPEDLYTTHWSYLIYDTKKLCCIIWCHRTTFSGSLSV